LSLLKNKTYVQRQPETEVEFEFGSTRSRMMQIKWQ